MLKSLEQEEMLNNAKKFYENREYAKAQRLLNEIIETDGQNTEAYFMIANIFHIQGEISKAIKAFKQVLAIDPTHTDASISLSVLYNDIGYYEEAKKIFNTASERVKVNKAEKVLEDDHINKKFSLKHYELAELYFTYNRFDEALFEYNKAIKLDPENLEARIKVAKVYAKKGFANKSLDELVQLKNEHPSYLPGRIALGVLYYGKGDVLKAQTEWEKVMSLDPVNSEAGMYLNLSKTATETSL
jgi:tetratricopeptide (TPR) repeat protein